MDFHDMSLCGQRRARTADTRFCERSGGAPHDRSVPPPNPGLPRACFEVSCSLGAEPMWWSPLMSRSHPKPFASVPSWLGGPLEFQFEALNDYEPKFRIVTQSSVATRGQSPLPSTFPAATRRVPSLPTRHSA